ARALGFVEYAGDALKREDIPSIPIRGVGYYYASALPLAVGAALRHPAITVYIVRALARCLVHMARTPSALPPRLAHGDLHSENVIGTTGVLQIIDWEESVFGPPGLDLVNALSVEWRDPPVRDYLLKRLQE